jgi:hypothetical protein
MLAILILHKLCLSLTDRKFGWLAISPGVRIYRIASPFPYYLVSATIFKNEILYIGEWLEYHLLVGIEKFFLYDNDSDDGPISILCPYIQSGLVNYTLWPGLVQQLPVYAFAIAHLRPISFWVAFIDVDEFLVPVWHSTIPPILRHFDDSAGLEMYTVVFGSGGQLNHTSGLVIERFVDHVPLKNEWSHIVKSIVNPRVVQKMGVHEAVYHGPGMFARDCRGSLLTEWLPWHHRTAMHDCIRVNHYWTKSFEEWCIKRQRGRAAGTVQREMNEYSYFGNWFGNNNTLMDRYIGDVKKRLAKRQHEHCELRFVDGIITH